MATTEFKIAPVGAWLKVSTALQNVVISHVRTKAVHVHVGAADPDASSAFHECRVDRPFSMSGISGQNVYIRSGDATEMQVTVTAV